MIMRHSKTDMLEENTYLKWLIDRVVIHSLENIGDIEEPESINVKEHSEGSWLQIGYRMKPNRNYMLILSWIEGNGITSCIRIIWVNWHLVLGSVLSLDYIFQNWLVFSISSITKHGIECSLINKVIWIIQSRNIKIIVIHLLTSI